MDDACFGRRMQSSRAITVTPGSSRKVLAGLPCGLQVKTRWRNSGWVLSINASARTLSGLSPERASDTISPGLADWEGVAAVREKRAAERVKIAYATLLRGVSASISATIS